MRLSFLQETRKYFDFRVFGVENNIISRSIKHSLFFIDSKRYLLFFSFLLLFSTVLFIILRCMILSYLESPYCLSSWFMIERISVFSLVFLQYGIEYEEFFWVRAHEIFWMNNSCNWWKEANQFFIISLAMNHQIRIALIIGDDNLKNRDNTIRILMITRKLKNFSYSDVSNGLR